MVPGNGNVYYGMNVSGQQRYEPIDQLDGFLVGKAMQLDTGASFYPYVAGVYGVFNTTSPQRARKTKRQMTRRETEKAGLLNNIMTNLQLEGKVVLASEIWDDPSYWQFFSEAIEQIGGEQKLIEDSSMQQAQFFGKLPKELLGSYASVLDADYLKEVDSAVLYLPAEIAEALWFRKNRGVEWKIGPESEQMYDTWIERWGIGTVEFRQPMSWDDVDGFDEPVPVSPYQGKERQQQRIFFSDTSDRLAFKREYNPFNPSLREAERLVELAKKLGISISNVKDLVALGVR